LKAEAREKRRKYRERVKRANKYKKIEGWKTVRTFYKKHMSPDYCRVAGWNATYGGKTMTYLWKKNRDWVKEYFNNIHHPKYYDNYFESKRNWVNRAEKLENILKNAENNVWDQSNVNSVLDECHNDTYYKKGPFVAAENRLPSYSSVSLDSSDSSDSYSSGGGYCCHCNGMGSFQGEACWGCQY
jgi:hypothetical protein